MVEVTPDMDDNASSMVLIVLGKMEVVPPFTSISPDEDLFVSTGVTHTGLSKVSTND